LPQNKKGKEVTMKDERAESSQKGGKDAVKDKQAGKPKKKGSREGAKGETEETIALRPLTMEGLKKQAKDHVIS
jgi:hypothetical protein